MPPKRLDGDWHRAHPMPPHATLDQRVAWHLEHQRHCGCRKIPASVERELARRRRGGLGTQPLAAAAAVGSPAIRLATAKDAPRLARLRYALRSEIDEPAEAEAKFLPRCTRWMRQRLGRGDSPWLCWVAVDGREIVGNLWLQRTEKVPNPAAEPEQHAYITNVYVTPERRDAGVGALLLAAALDWCRRSEVDAVTLWPSPRSRSFYARHGFIARDDLFALRPVGR